MLARVLTVLLGLFLATAVADETLAEPMLMGTMLQCDNEPGKIISMVQEKYGEIPFSTAQGVIQNINGSWMKAEVVTTINPSSMSYSVIIIEPDSGTECLLLAGSNFAPAFSVQGDPL
jgi:hypothetical protein